jgi:hypothetical protein
MVQHMHARQCIYHVTVQWTVSEHTTSHCHFFLGHYMLLIVFVISRSLGFCNSIGLVPMCDDGKA